MTSFRSLFLIVSNVRLLLPLWSGWTWHRQIRKLKSSRGVRSRGPLFSLNQSLNRENLLRLWFRLRHQRERPRSILGLYRWFSLRSLIQLLSHVNLW
ncbi:hypothetical protein FCV25MIE_07823 [Fagus crenata]